MGETKDPVPSALASPGTRSLRKDQEGEHIPRRLNAWGALSRLV
jgi:hypothetical protein